LTEKALITGIEGFVGSHLAEYLLFSTSWQVSGTVYGSTENIAHIAGSLDLHRGDLRSLDTVLDIVGQVRPDYIFHLAAQPLVPLSRRDPWGTLETNIRMQLNILETVKRLCPECRVLVVGSSEEYGPVRSEDLPVDEDTPLRPANPYAVSKVTQDMLGLQYHLSDGLHTIRVRPFNHIGPRQRLGFVAPDFAKQIAEAEAGLREPVVRVGNLSAQRDFSDVRDVVRAYHLLITQGKAGEVYNIGSGQAHSIQELLDTLVSMSRVPITVEVDPERLRPADVPLIVCDSTRLRQCTGWQPIISFEQSLRDVLYYWRMQIGQSGGKGF